MATQVLTANTFDGGAVVYLGEAGWVSTIAEARLFTCQDALDTALRHAAAMPDRLIGPYAIEVTCSEGLITPVAIRERIRAMGPGNYHHGKQAGDEAEHVSIY